MKISIITPVKNAEEFISEAVESVLNQKGNFDLEYLIMDGGSTDNTLKICEDYKSQIANSTRKIFCKSIDIKIFSKTDSGMYDALADGISLLTGEIVGYLNSDDFYLPNSFDCLYQAFERYKELNWITGLPIRYNEQGHIINFSIPWKYKSSFILKGMYGTILPFIQQESVFWRRKLGSEIDIDNLRRFKLAGDFYLWHSFAKAGNKLIVMDSFLGGNRLRKGQLSENKTKYMKEFNSIKNASNFLDFFPVLFHKIVILFAGRFIKRRFSKNRLRYVKENWVIQ